MTRIATLNRTAGYQSDSIIYAVSLCSSPYTMKVKNTFLEVAEDEPRYAARRSSSAHAVLQHVIFNASQRQSQRSSAKWMPANVVGAGQMRDRPTPKTAARMTGMPEISHAPALGYGQCKDGKTVPRQPLHLPCENSYNLTNANLPPQPDTPSTKVGSSQNSTSGDSDDIQMPSEESWNVTSTTVMIRGIPCGFTQEQLLDMINQSGLQGKYDFFYLPRAGNSVSNLGYAFVNFTDAASAMACATALHGLSLDPSRSSKVCTIFPAHIQGYNNLKKRFRRTAMRRGARGPLFFEQANSVTAAAPAVAA